MPHGVPIQWMFQPRSSSALAIASPGKMCPPDPAAIMRMVLAISSEGKARTPMAADATPIPADKSKSDGNVRDGDGDLDRAALIFALIFTLQFSAAIGLASADIVVPTALVRSGPPP